MTDLSHDARSLVARARVHEGPSAADRARLRARLEPAWAAHPEVGTSAASSGLRALAERWPFGKILVFLVVAGWSPAQPSAAGGPEPATVLAVAPPLDAPAPPHAPRRENAQPPETASARPQPLAAGVPAPRARVSRQAVVAPARASSTAQRRRTLAREDAQAEAGPRIARSTAVPSQAQVEVVPEKSETAVSVTGLSSSGSTGTAAVSNTVDAPRSSNHLVRPQDHAAPSQSGTDFKPQAIDDELAWIGAAQEALQNHKPSLALRLVEEHGFRFPDGALTQERLVVHTLALCSLERFTAARRMLEVLEERAPDAPIVARVRSTCGL